MMNRSRSVSSIRSFSTQIEKKEVLDLVSEPGKNTERFRRFTASNPIPVGFRLKPSGKDLYLPKNIAELAVFNGMPKQHQQRTVIIAPRIMKPVQAGTFGSNQWQLYWKNLDKNSRWTNALTGWTSTADPLSNVVLNFSSKEGAIRFAERNGWNYELIREVNTQIIPDGTYKYEDNFLPIRTVLQLKKEGLKNKIWENPKYGESHWFMPLKYHGDGVVEQHGPKNNAK